MNSKNIQTFLKVADLKSFTKAAESLNYAQSSVTSQIQQLEEELEFPLFDRIGKQIFITSQGQEFLLYAKQLQKIYQQAYAIGKNLVTIRGELRIGVLESLVFSSLQTVLPKYKQLYPNVIVKIQVGRASDLFEWLKQNQIDLVYLSSETFDYPEIFCCYKRKESLAFFAGVQHPLAFNKKISLAELFQHPLLSTEENGICFKILRELASGCGAIIWRSIEVDNTKAIAGLLSSGFGFALLPEYSVKSELKRGELVKLNVDMQPQIYYSQILYHKSKFVVPYMKDFISIVNDELPGTMS